MNSKLMAELPAGATATVFLKNGVTFTGDEAGDPLFRDSGILRMTKQLPDGGEEVFFTEHDQVACFTMVCHG